MNKIYICTIIISIILELIAINSLSRTKLIYKNRKITREVDDIYFLVLVEYAKWNELEEFKIVYEECINPELNQDILLRVSLLYNNLDVFYYLIDTKGVNISIHDDFALRYAVFSNDTYLVHYALSRGANLHVRNDDILLDVIEKEKIDILKLLLLYNKSYNETLIQNMIDISSSYEIDEILEDYQTILEYRSMN